MYIVHVAHNEMVCFGPEDLDMMLCSRGIKSEDIDVSSVGDVNICHSVKIMCTRFLHFKVDYFVSGSL